MPKKSSKKILHSPAETTLDLIGNKWTIFVIEELFKGTRRFGEIEKGLVGISPRTLSLRLASLEKAGVIERQVFPEVPPRVEYSLSSLGRSLEDVIASIKEWGIKLEKNSN